MADAIPGPEPEFCLGGTIYPVNPSFDWSDAKDVLEEAVNETAIAMRMHSYAVHDPDPLWFACMCADREAHMLALGAGQLELTRLLDVERYGPTHAPKVLRQQWAHLVQVLIIALFAWELLPDLDLVF